MLTKRMEKSLDGNYKNAASNIEQALEPAPYKAAAVRSHTTHHENYTGLQKLIFGVRQEWG